jgi:hypothetical protein
MMTVRFWRAEIASDAEGLLTECAPMRFPVDLTRLAVKRGITKVHFRPMPCDGAIGVAEDGFVVHLQSRKEQLVPAPAVDSSALSPRQRFTLAHEISHTFFYGPDLKRVEPHPSQRLLEDSCNYAAARLLLPANLLRYEIGRNRKVDSIEMACDLASTAHVSTEVLLQRLDELEDLKETDYALLALRKEERAKIIVIAVCSQGVFREFVRPTLFAAPPKWVQRMVPELSAATGAVHRIPHRNGGEFVSRCVLNERAQRQILVESRLDASPRSARSSTD